MSVMEVLVYPNPILRQPTAVVTVFDERLQALINDMFDTMEAYQGVGLAAPQVGVLEKIIVTSFQGRSMALINPEIVYAEGSVIGEEGCLSIPTMTLDVERALKVIVKAQTPTGDPIEIRKSGYYARILQHEIDHLNGVLIIDKQVARPS